MSGLPLPKRPFGREDYRKARTYLDERVRAGDFNVTTRLTMGAHWSEIGSVHKEAASPGLWTHPTPPVQRTEHDIFD